MTTSREKTGDKDGFARPFAEIKKLDYSRDFVLVFPDGPRDEDGERPIIITDNTLKDCVQMDADTINTAFSSRVRPLVKGLLIIARGCGPSMACGKYAIDALREFYGDDFMGEARKALEEFRGL